MRSSLAVTAFRWRSRRTDSPRPHPCGRGSVSAKPRFRRLSVAHEPAGFQPAVVQAGPSRAGSQASSDLVPQPVSTGFRATLAFTRIEPHSCPLCAILGELGATMSHFSPLAGSAFARPSFCEQNPQNRAARISRHGFSYPVVAKGHGQSRIFKKNIPRVFNTSCPPR